MMLEIRDLLHFLLKACGRVVSTFLEVNVMSKWLNGVNNFGIVREAISQAIRFWNSVTAVARLATNGFF